MISIFSKSVEPPATFTRYLEAGIEAHRAGNADLSTRNFRKCLEISPDRWDILAHLAAVQSDITGDIEESLRLLRRARHLRKRLLTPPEGPPPYCFLQAPWGSDVAGIASMERVVKREILRGRDSKRIVHYTSQRHGMQGHALLDKMAAYITLVTDESALPLPRHAMLSALEDHRLCESLDGLHKHAWHASADIARAWTAAGRGPLLSFSKQEMDSGAEYLQKLGLPEGSWFVCLHPGGEDVAAYMPAVLSVTQRGGWVVCLGGSSDARPAIPRVVDHALRSDAGGELDIFLLGACRFFIGTGSDQALVPPLFGTPCVLTNWAPAGRRPLSSADIYIPKLYNAGSPRHPLTFRQIMAPPLGHAVRYEHAGALDLTPVPNTADEICEAVEEMLERLDGTHRSAERDEALQTAFDAVAQTNRCFGAARVGQGFLRRHSSLLMNA